MSDPVIFLGPTMPRDEAQAILEAIYLPPAAQGDLVAAYEKHKPRVIGLVDGYFECIPSVWHKEILYLMDEGVHVYGSSSMGALRAAELHPFGMIGIGEVFDSYRLGVIEDDDEVAVVHGPEDLGYPALSEAMVNIRRTLRDAMESGIITRKEQEFFTAAGKELHYKRRNFSNIFNIASESGFSADTEKQLKQWLPTGRRDQKKEDAHHLLRLVKSLGSSSAQPKEVQYTFRNTSMWAALVKSLETWH